MLTRLDGDGDEVFKARRWNFDAVKNKNCFVTILQVDADLGLRQNLTIVGGGLDVDDFGGISQSITTSRCRIESEDHKRHADEDAEADENGLKSDPTTLARLDFGGLVESHMPILTARAGTLHFGR